MCKGLGLDVCEIARMEKLLEDDRFLARFFTPAEAEYIRSRGVGAARTMAGLFAAREALDFICTNLSSTSLSTTSLSTTIFCSTRYTSARSTIPTTNT